MNEYVSSNIFIVLKLKVTFVLFKRALRIIYLLIQIYFIWFFFHSIYVQIAFWSHHLCLPKDSFDRCFVYRFLLIYFYVLSFVHVCLLKWPSYVVFQLINFVGVCVYKICPHKLIHFKKEKKKNTLYDDLAFSLIWNYNQSQFNPSINFSFSLCLRCGNKYAIMISPLIFPPLCVTWYLKLIRHYLFI